MNVKKWQNNIEIFLIEYKLVKMYCNVCNKYRKSQTTKISYILKELSLSIVYSKYGHGYEKYLKKKN